MIWNVHNITMCCISSYNALVNMGWMAFSFKDLNTHIEFNSKLIPFWNDSYFIQMLLNCITKCNVEFKLDCDGIFSPKSITEMINKLSIL